MSDDRLEARAFAESVAGVLDRHPPARRRWAPGETAAPLPPELMARLNELGWAAVAGDPELVDCAALGAVELGRRLAPLEPIDGLLGGAPVVGDLVRWLGPGRVALVAEGGALRRRAVLRSEPLASADGLDVQRVLELGETLEALDVRGDPWPVALDAWMAAGIGYLAGLGEGVLELTVGYVRQRRAFDGTLAALAPVQQLLAAAATAVRGVRLLAGEPPDAEALAHAGPAVAGACAACQQATGAIGFTLEYPLHAYTQRARALAAWNEVLLDGPLSRPRSPAADASRV